jgi:hypothetical protein
LKKTRSIGSLTSVEKKLQALLSEHTKSEELSEKNSVLLWGLKLGAVMPMQRVARRYSRHTYASNWLSVHKDRPELAEYMGNSPQIIGQKYHRPVPEAKRFWQIVQLPTPLLESPRLACYGECDERPTCSDFSAKQGREAPACGGTVGCASQEESQQPLAEWKIDELIRKEAFKKRARQSRTLRKQVKAGIVGRNA